MAAYAGSLALGFIYDDFTAIVGNEHIRHLWPLTAAAAAPPQSALAGRPIVSVSMAINFALGGLSPVGYHAWNLTVHVLCGVLLFAVLRRTTAFTSEYGRQSQFAAFAVTSLWLVHPLTSEVVDYVTQRTESMMALCALATLYAAIRAGERNGHEQLWTAAAIAVCAIGMGTKESMATIPVLVVLYDVAMSHERPGAVFRKRWTLYAGLAATWLVVVALNLGGPRWRSAGFSSGVAPLDYFENQLPMIVTYLKLAFWPAPLVLDYGVPRSLPLHDVWPSALVVVTLGLVALLAWWRSRPLAFAGTAFFVLLAPTSSFVPIATEAGAERRVYLPLICLIVLAVGAVSRVAKATGVVPTGSDGVPGRRILAAAALGATGALLMLLTIARTSEYRSETSIWQTVVARHPHARAHYNLGVALAASGNRQAAIDEYRVAAAADWPPAHYALGFELQNDRQFGQAIQEYTKYIQLAPADAQVPHAHLQIARAALSQGNAAEAESAFRQALALTPDSSDARGELAGLLLDQKRFPEAAEEYGQYLQRQPGSAPGHHNLALALAETDRLPEAIEQFRQAVALGPADLDLRENLARALAAAGRLNDAAAEFEAVIARSPHRASAHAALADVLIALGRRDEAAAHVRQSLSP